VDDQLPISYEQMRSLVVEFLSQAGGGQMNDLRTAIPRLAEKHGHLSKISQQLEMGYKGHDWSHLSDPDYSRALDIMWDLIIEGVVRPGTTQGEVNFPFFHVTEFGKEKIKDPVSPYDPEGYLRGLKAAVPDLDDVIVIYLNEGLHTFRIGTLLSSTMALGCASEKAFLLLVKAYGDALQGNTQKKFRQNTEGKLIKRQFDEFSKMLDSHLKAKLPGDLTADLDVTLSGIFTLLRNLRNEIGHPTGRSVDREQAYANLRVFPHYVKRIYGLIRWLNANSPLP
jgi:hypothetical protein